LQARRPPDEQHKKDLLHIYKMQQSTGDTKPREKFEWISIFSELKIGIFAKKNHKKKNKSDKTTKSRLKARSTPDHEKEPIPAMMQENKSIQLKKQEGL